MFGTTLLERPVQGGKASSSLQRGALVEDLGHLNASRTRSLDRRKQQEELFLLVFEQLSKSLEAWL